MYHILIICTGNICRSPMAEGLLKQMLPNFLQSKTQVSSAGIHVTKNNQTQHHAIEVMKQFDIDLTKHRARPISRKLLKTADLILVMEQAHAKEIIDKMPSNQKKIHLLSEFGNDRTLIDIPDPYGSYRFAYRASAMMIKECLEGLVQYFIGRLPANQKKTIKSKYI